MSNETIKDQVRRLIAGIAPCYEKNPNLIKDDDYCFGFLLEVVELAIAEVVEACAGIAEAAGSDANKYDIADSIRARGAAPKDEVSE